MSPYLAMKSFLLIFCSFLCLTMSLVMSWSLSNAGGMNGRYLMREGNRKMTWNKMSVPTFEDLEEREEYAFLCGKYGKQERKAGQTQTGRKSSLH